MTLATHSRKNAPIVLAFLVVGLLIAVLQIATAATLYKATTRLDVNPDMSLLTTNGQDAAVSSAYEASVYTQQRALTYVQLVDQAAVLGPVADRLGTSENALSGHVQATVVPSTSLIDVSATAATPAKAAQLANDTAGQLAKVVRTLEQVRLSNAVVTPVKITQTSPATEPTAKDSPRPARSLLLGGLVALLLGLVVAAVRALFDSSIMSAAPLAAAGSPPIGSVGRDRTLDRHPLVVSEAPTSPTADNFRQIRTSLQFTSLDEPPHSVVVTGAGAKSGATTVACNVALAFAQAGYRAVLVDGNLRDRGASTAFGMADKPGLAELLEGRADLADTITVPGPTPLEVLPAGTTGGFPGDLLGSPRLADLVGELEKRSEVVVIDAPSALSSPEAQSLSAVSDGTVLVVRHGRTTRRQLESALEILRGVHGNVLGTVLAGAPQSER